MRYRPFGKTGVQVSEVGFGAWGIGGGYGTVRKADSLNALARAEELGCNFVDSALVYGDAEAVLGEFLQGRRQRWLVATKYSGQKEGMTATLEQQLRLLRTDAVDFYQIHWYPRGRSESLFDELEQLKRAGKVRFAGVSLYSAFDVRDALKRPEIDGFQIAFNLLAPEPFLDVLNLLERNPKAVVVRSALKEGFLTGQYGAEAKFTDQSDQRREWSRERIRETVASAERFRFLEQEAGSMLTAAVGYPLAFPSVSTVILGTKTVDQADVNFGSVPGNALSGAALERVVSVQRELGLRAPAWRRWITRMRLRLG